MKYEDIERMASDAVRDYLNDGWTLEMCNSSFSGVEGIHFVSRDGEHVAVGIRTPEYKEGFLRAWHDGVRPVLMFISLAPKRSFDWLAPENVIYEKVLFEVDGDWYVEDEAVAVEARAKRIERWGVEPRSGRTFHPTKAFLDKWVRGMYGWKAVKPCDVVITKETCADGIYYHVRKTVGKEDWFIVRSSGKR